MTQKIIDNKKVSELMSELSQPNREVLASMILQFAHEQHLGTIRKFINQHDHEDMISKIIIHLVARLIPDLMTNIHTDITINEKDTYDGSDVAIIVIQTLQDLIARLQEEG